MIGLGIDLTMRATMLASASPYTQYALALDFDDQEYWSGGAQAASLSAMSGYSFSRSGEQGAVDSDGTIDWFAANTPAVNGAGYHAYGALTNNLLYSRDLTNAAWTKRGTAAVATDAQAGADGTGSASKVTVVAMGTNDIFQSLPVGLSPSFFIKKVSVSGTLRVQNPSAGGQYWDIDLALLGSGWERVGPGHAAVTGGPNDNGPWTTHGGLQFGAVAGTLTFYIDFAQVLDSGYFPDGGPIIRTTTAAASIGESILNVGSPTLADEDMLLMVAATSANGTATLRSLGAFSNGPGGERIDWTLDGATATARIIIGGGVALSHTMTMPAETEGTYLWRRLAGQWRAGKVVAGVLTWAGAASTLGFPTGLNRVDVGNYGTVGGYALQGRVRIPAVKLGTFDTDAKVLAAAAEIA